MLLKENALIYRTHPSRRHSHHGWDEFKARMQAVVARAYSPRLSQVQQKTYPSFKDTVRPCLWCTDSASLPGEQGWWLNWRAPCDPSGRCGLNCRCSRALLCFLL